MNLVNSALIPAFPEPKVPGLCPLLQRPAFLHYACIHSLVSAARPHPLRPRRGVAALSRMRPLTQVSLKGDFVHVWALAQGRERDADFAWF